MQSTTNFRPVSLKKAVSHFSRNLWPWICKKSKKTGYLRKFFFSLETTQNALKFVRNIICAVHDKFPVGISQKRRWSFFKKSVTLDIKKKSKNLQFLKKNFFARNNLKCLKICSQHHLCSPRHSQHHPRQNFRPVSLKKEVGHFSRNLWPWICKKVKKFAIFEKIFFRSKKFFSARNNLKRLKIRSQHHLCSPRQISGQYLSKKKLVIFQEICDPG